MSDVLMALGAFHFAMDTAAYQSKTKQRLPLAYTSSIAGRGEPMILADGLGFVWGRYVVLSLQMPINTWEGLILILHS